MHLQVWVVAAPGPFHPPHSRHAPQSPFCPPILPPGPGGLDALPDALSRGAFSEESTQVDPVLRVKAEVPLTVRGETASVTALTEGPGGGGDDAEYRSIRKREPVGGRRGLLDQGTNGPVTLCEQVQNLRPREDPIRRPSRRPSHVHVLDEAHLGSYAFAVL